MFASADTSIPARCVNIRQHVYFRQCTHTSSRWSERFAYSCSSSSGITFYYSTMQLLRCTHALQRQGFGPDLHWSCDGNTRRILWPHCSTLRTRGEVRNSCRRWCCRSRLPGTGKKRGSQKCRLRQAPHRSCCSSQLVHAAVARSHVGNCTCLHSALQTKAKAVDGPNSPHTTECFFNAQCFRHLRVLSYVFLQRPYCPTADAVTRRRVKSRSSCSTWVTRTLKLRQALGWRRCVSMTGSVSCPSIDVGLAHGMDLSASPAARQQHQPEA